MVIVGGQGRRSINLQMRIKGLYSTIKYEKGTGR